MKKNYKIYNRNGRTRQHVKSFSDWSMSYCTCRYLCTSRYHTGYSEYYR